MSRSPMISIFGTGKFDRCLFIPRLIGLDALRDINEYLNRCKDKPLPRGFRNQTQSSIR